MKKISLTAMAFFGLVAGWSASGQGVADFSAGAGAISPPFVLTNGYIFQQIQTTATNGGRAVYKFTAPAPGQYAIRAVVEAPSQDANSLFVNIDSEPKDPEMKWEIPVGPGFRTNWVATATGAPRFFDLTNGTHRVIIRGSEPNVKLSRIVVGRRPNPPADLRVVTGNK